MKTLWMGTRATGALIGLMLLVVLAVFGVLRSPLVVERETAEEMPGAETDLPDVANNLDPEATLTPASYSNPKVGVQWRAPSSDWYFAEFPSPDFDDSSVHGLAVLVAPDGETTFPLAYLSFQEEGLDDLGPELVEDPDAFFEQTEITLPEEAIRGMRRTEVAGAPALAVDLQQQNVNQVLHLILRQNGVFYLFAQSPDDLDPALVEAGVRTFAFTEPSG